MKFETGLKRGYVRIGERFVESEKKDIATEIVDCKKNSNKYKALNLLLKNGYTQYATSRNQHDNSTRFYYEIYKAY